MPLSERYQAACCQYMLAIFCWCRGLSFSLCCLAGYLPVTATLRLRRRFRESHPCLHSRRTPYVTWAQLANFKFLFFGLQHISRRSVNILIYNIQNSASRIIYKYNPKTKKLQRRRFFSFCLICIYTKAKNLFSEAQLIILVKMKKVKLWGVPLWVNITPDGYRVGDVYHSIEEAEEAAKASILRLEIIRIQ